MREPTIEPVDTHHEVYAVIKLFVILLGGEVGQIRGQEREVAVKAGLKTQLFEQLVFGFVETGVKGKFKKYLVYWQIRCITLSHPPGYKFQLWSQNTSDSSSCVFR